MNEYIHYVNEKNFYDDYFKFILIYSPEKYSKYKKNQNNNDTFIILSSLFKNFKSFITSLSILFISYMATMQNFFYKLQLILLLIVFLFSFVMTFEENSEVPTNLIISAYFPKKHLTRISYGMAQDEPKEDDYPDSNLETIDFEDINQLIKEKIIKENEEKKENIKNSYKDTCDNDKYKYFFDSTVNKCKNRNYNKNNNNKNKNNKYVINKHKLKIKEKEKENDDPFSLPLKLNKQNGKIIMTENEFLSFYYGSFKNILINCLSFSFLYFYIRFTLDSNIKGSLVFNIFFVFLSFNFLYSLYKAELYLASNVFFILLIYINKNLVDSIYLMIEFKRKDFEIFSTSLTAFDFRQFHLKCILLLNLTILSGVLSIFFFKSFLNYIIFYICLFTLIVFLSNCIEPLMPYYLKPVKNIIIFFVGLFNFIFSKITLRMFFSEGFLAKQTSYFKKYINNYDIAFKNDSLYFVSDLFSFFCFDYIREYLELQINLNEILDFFIDNDNDEDAFNKENINKKSWNQFGKWILFMWISMLIGIIGIFKKEYICLIMSIYLVKVLMNYFCNLYDVLFSRFLLYIHSLFFLIINLNISTNENKYLVNLFSSSTNIGKDKISFIIRLITLLLLVYYIIVINIILYNKNSNTYTYEQKTKSIQKDNIDINLIHIEVQKIPMGNFKKITKYVLVFSDCFINYAIICLLIKIYHDYEKSIVLKGIYAILILIFHVLKTLNINRIIDIYEYIINLFVWLLFSIRMINISSNVLSLPFFINHFNLMVLIICYYLNEKKNIFFTMIIYIFLVIGYFYFHSYMFLLDSIITVVTLIIISFISLYNKTEKKERETEDADDDDDDDENIKDEEEKENKEEIWRMNIYNSLSILFLIPILIFFALQLKFQNYFHFLNELDKYIKRFMMRMYILYNINYDYNENGHKVEPIEWSIISQFIDIMKIISINLKNKE